MIKIYLPFKNLKEKIGFEAPAPANNLALQPALQTLLMNEI